VADTKDKEIKTTIIDMSELANDDFKAPAKFFIINAMGECVYIHVRTRAEAEKWLTENYGKGFYSLRTSSSEKPKGDLSCTGSNTRRGFSPRLKGIKG
jgi:hypothetical protein